MIAITKGVLALSALASAGVVAFDASPAIDQDSAAYQVSHRFPRADESFARVIPVKPQADGTKAIADGRKGDRLDSSCGQREWPYIAQACLVSSNGSPMRKISRVVAIERRIADNASEVAIVPAAFASR